MISLWIYYAFCGLLLLSSIIKQSAFLAGYYLLSNIVCVLYVQNIINILLFWSITSIIVLMCYSYMVNSDSFENKTLPHIHTISQFIYFLYMIGSRSTEKQIFVQILVNVTSIALVVISIFVILLILFQRGEEGVFARDNMLSNQFASEDITMVKSTILFGTVFLILSLTLSLLWYISHKSI